jgi:hypothetical protein
MTTIDKAQLSWIEELCKAASTDDAYRIKAPFDIAPQFRGYFCQCEYEVEDYHDGTVRINYGAFVYDDKGEFVGTTSDIDDEPLVLAFYDRAHRQIYDFIDELAPLFGFSWDLRPGEDLITTDPTLSAPLKVKDA